MPMKISLGLGKRQTLSRQTAWGFFSANLAFPGTGSLAAGYRIGYAQLTLALAGTLLTVGFGTRFLFWYASNWSRLRDPSADPLLMFTEIILHVRWALAGFAVFAVSWFWAIWTGMRIVRSVPKSVTPSRVPPKL
jgi:hypothetical protein